ncbi:MAG: valine--tRNA ligase [Anaerolineales bacterium]|nr:valine--tRNA ligase [Anaerolineales bacterium]
MTEFTLSKRYEFDSIEKELYNWWEEQGFFRPRMVEGQEPYVISMPPPNVTGELHLGHAITIAIEDMMIRHSRMKGVPTLWVPGSDHAGIATQLQVEQHILRTEELTREEVGREEFVERTWEWKKKYGGIITNQLRRLGASCDWERERFTMDEGLSRAVREAFVRLYEKGLIYRGDYLVNWSPGLKTAVSNLEVEYFEEEAKLYYFKYPVANSDEFIPVATTRPETILGDTAVAVHPDDDRFRHLIGETCLVPILNRPIPVIEDSYVDLEFGTGALKITPGHDPADYEIGERHGLEIINVLNPDATMNANAGPYVGLDRYQCRDRMWRDMKAEGLTIRTEPYIMQVPRSQRGGEIIEPMISTQWFVKMKPLAEPALEAVRQGKIQIIPERFTSVYYNWLENIRDWCISRQLWWGHQIPAWHCGDCGEIMVMREDPDRCAHCGSENIERDPDVLDTWFSSGLWPFSTLGWPDETEDMKTFYPTTMMETGYDILFFWVARMIMFGLEFTDKVPFHYVYLHGLVRAEGRRKMSKSLGNVIDPVDLMDEYGTDALRFTLLTGSTPGNDMSLNMTRLEANRNFANKLWNATRLIINSIERAPAQSEQDLAPTLPDRWILARLAQLNRDVNRLIDTYQYGEAGRQIHEFFWSEFADWYLEIAKLQMNEGGSRAWDTAQVLVIVLDTCLRFLHPFIPYVTETLWGHLKTTCNRHPAKYGPENEWGEALIAAKWPEPSPEQEQENQDITDFNLIMDLIRSIRNLRTEKDVEPGYLIIAMIQAGRRKPIIESMCTAIAALAYLDPEKLVIEETLESKPVDAIPLVVGPLEVYFPLSGMLDVEEEIRRINKELEEVNSQIQRLNDLLAGPFASRAPAEVVAKEQDKLASLEETAKKLEDQLTELS